MEFKIKQSVLRDELSNIQGVVERKTTIPVLSNILIESLGENEIRIIGTDLDCTIRCDAEAEIISPGSICIQARRLFDIVRALNADEVHFKKEDNEWVTMRAGRANFKLAGVGRDLFPELPQFKSTPMRLSAENFAYFIRNTAFAMTTEQSRFTLSGAKFIVGEGMAKMVTTDGHRLAYVSCSIDDKEAVIDTLIPKKALLELVKLSRGVGDVAFGEDANHLYFEIEGRLLITRKLTGQFPNYEMVMPKDNDKSVVFDLEEMRGAVRRMSLIAEERTRSLRILLRNNEIEVIAQASEEGEGNEVVQADYAGDEIQLGFNWQYLFDFLNNAALGDNEMTGGEAAEAASNGDGTAAAPAREDRPPLRVRFDFKDANSQTQMSIDGESTYDYRYVVMPLRI